MWIHSTSLCSTLPNAPPPPMPLGPCKLKTTLTLLKACGKAPYVENLTMLFVLFFCLLRFPTGLGIKESDTRKTLVSSKRKPTCTLRELPSMRLMHPHTEAKQIHPQLQTLQVRQEVPGSAKLFDMYFLSVHHYS